ncbi:lipase family alpha/beta hydrolase [Acinetobacter haemolyticus]|uniref:lipase family alpha/beta hydrolase n=1 Tax=Acinetobacter haemolyticus TaxID=29430 RepID=UPI000D6862D0|nr:alpha/beta fold hydrolase [Acinetobacter haemolyticus]
MSYLNFSLMLCGLLSLSACQVIHLKEEKLSHSLKSKVDNFLITNKFSYQTENFLYLTKTNQAHCLNNVDDCVNQIKKINGKEDDLYAAVSEIYLAKAMSINTDKCNRLGKTNNCLDQKLRFLDKSLRHSYAYLFKSNSSAQERIFDYRLNQVRIIYNVSISQMLTSAFKRDGRLNDICFESHCYLLDFKKYPALETLQLNAFKSSYNMNFSGFNIVNRQDGLGAEFVAERDEKPIQPKFILNPYDYFKDRPNPNIHQPKFFPITAIAEPKKASNTNEILGNTNFKIHLFDPFQTTRVEVEGSSYVITGNYSAPYGAWLAKNNLGALGYWTLINKERNLIMPHLYMLEPYHPQKKVVVLIHGLASSPEAWVSLTNDIIGAEDLRENYQVWNVFYSTNMPIFESRYQIHALLQQAFNQFDTSSQAHHQAVLIGHSMGGVISRLLVSQADISSAAIQKMNAAQLSQYQQQAAIKQRFQFVPLTNFSRAIFIAAPHQGTQYADRWFTQIARKIIKLPYKFYTAVEQGQGLGKPHQKGLIENGAGDLSHGSNFMQLSKQIQPETNVIYHSIVGNTTSLKAVDKMTDGIVPYQSSHLPNAASELIIRGGHSIQETPEAILEIRRILRLHLTKTQTSSSQ